MNYNKYIFLDCGAHIGESIKHFLKSHIKNKDKYEIHSFEAHPKNFERLKNVYGKNKKIKLYNCAIWNEDNDKLPFYQKKNFNYNGSSSLLKYKTTGGLDKDNPLYIKSIDFSKFIINNMNKDDYIILKMDIEGAEY